MSRILPALFAAVLLAAAAGPPAAASDNTNPKKAASQAAETAPLLRVFIDGSLSASDYLKMEIGFVSYVRDRRDADVHIIVTRRSSEAGTEFHLEWIGLGRYEDLHYSLTHFSDRFETSDEEREGLVGVLKIGMMPFISRSGLANQVKISFDKRRIVETAPAADPWDSWIFSFHLGGSLRGESNYDSTSSWGGFSAGRTTDSLKAGGSMNWNTSWSRYVLEDGDVDTSVRSWKASGWAIHSLNRRWSAGFYADTSSSTYANMKLSFRFSPAVEFDVFPYAESTRKVLTVLYRLIFAKYRYYEETVHGRTAESRLSEALAVRLKATQPWGEAYASIAGSHYFHDWTKNRLSVDGYFSVRIWKGLSVYTRGKYALIHDQLSLAQGDLPKDEILLRLKQLSTTYDYSLSMGISYSFGSKMSRAVNPRMETLIDD